MKPIRLIPTFSRFAAMAILAGLSVCAHAATITVSSTAPTVNGDDIANLVTSTGSDSVWNDRPLRGQTFVTGSNTGGYELNSVTILLLEGDGTILGWKDYRMRVGTFSGTTGDPFLDEVTRYNPDEPTDSYFTYTFTTPLTLAANTTYSFEFGISNSEDGWPAGIPAVAKSGNTYAGGGFYSTANQGTIANLDDSSGTPSGSQDLIFHADIVAVPEPRAALLGALGLLALLRRRR